MVTESFYLVLVLVGAEPCLGHRGQNLTERCVGRVSTGKGVTNQTSNVN